MPSEGANGSSPFVTGDVAFRPREFTTAINTWASVPYCDTDFAPYNDTSADHLIAVHNPVAGLGDICRHMGVVDGATWRIPTTVEWAKLYGSPNQDKGQAAPLGHGWITGNYYPLSGLAMGSRQNDVSILDEDINARVINADPNTSGAVFIPASGYRHYTDGTIWGTGSSGHYWPSTAQSAVNGYDMGFNSTTVVPQWSDTRAFALSVRCIRE